MSEPFDEHGGSPAMQAGDRRRGITGEVADAPGREEQPASNAAATTDEYQQDSLNGMDGGHPLVREASSFRSRWESVQVSFVDDPRQAVSDAEALVGDVLTDLTSGFRRQHQELQSIWDQGQEASTEHLRQTFQRYRDFFERLLRV